MHNARLWQQAKMIMNGTGIGVSISHHNYIPQPGGHAVYGTLITVMRR